MIQTAEVTVVKKLEWFSNNTDMIVTCEIQSGSFKYDTNIALSGDSLNQVLSDLQKQQPQLDLNDCMKVEQWSEEESSFIFDFTLMNEVNFQFTRPTEVYNFRQIRA